MIATILVIEVPKGVSAQVMEEWVERYKGPGNYIDMAEDIITDSSGNAYVTGYSIGNGTHYDFATIAYNSHGNELWVKRYNGPGNDMDVARAIASDALGNVYVTGHSGGVSSDQDYATIKYNAMGNELWVARYDGPLGDMDYPSAMAVDIYGHIYVTGVSYGSLSPGGTLGDYATVAYDTNGNELWVARYNGPRSEFDYANAIVADSSGNVYVTGESRGIGTWEDYATIAYDSLGNELWVTRYDGLGSRYDYARAIAIDSSGNVYVTGGSEGNGTDYDYTTIKYDPYGNELWVARYNGPGNSRDDAYDIAIDMSGNTYVTGISFAGVTGYDYTTLAYDSNGKELWVMRYNGHGNGTDFARAIALDASGNVYVTGYSEGVESREDYTTVAYDPSGKELWVVRYDGPGNDMDRASAIATDLSGNVYVTGESYGIGTDRDYATIKYSQKGPTQILQATIDIDPDTLNLKSKGRWITCYITLNNPYNVNDIDISTILLEDSLPVEWGDIQGDRLMVKFDRSEVEDMLSVGTYNLKVTGELTDGTLFEGYSDEIRVIDPGK
jgi:hypothetical protein